jgi:hypothetical protein
MLGVLYTLCGRRVMSFCEVPIFLHPDQRMAPAISSGGAA